MRSLRHRHYCSALLGTRAFVQAQGAPRNPRRRHRCSSVRHTSIQVRRVKDLNPVVRSKVDEVVAQTARKICSTSEVYRRDTEAASALKAKGLSSSQVLLSTSPTVSDLFARQLETRRAAAIRSAREATGPGHTQLRN